MLFILLLPYIALPAFFFFGSRKQLRPRRHQRPHLHDRFASGAPEAWAIDTILALGQPEPAPNENFTVHQDGHAARQALMAILDGARTLIDLCSFILGDDDLGKAVIDCLALKAAQGVRIRLLLDGMGSVMTPHPDLRRLT
jgi:cardiolipin synthase